MLMIQEQVEFFFSKKKPLKKEEEEKVHQPRSEEDWRTEGLRWECHQQKDILEQRAPIDFLLVYYLYQYEEASFFFFPLFSFAILQYPGLGLSRVVNRINMLTKALLILRLWKLEQAEEEDELKWNEWWWLCSFQQSEVDDSYGSNVLPHYKAQTQPATL